MAASDIHWASARSIADSVRRGDLSVRDVARAMVERIEEQNPAINAYVSFDAEQVLRDAAELDERAARGEDLGPLHGVPYSIKDLVPVKGLPMTLGLKSHLGVVADRDEELHTRMRAAGGLFLGKTNASELGYYGGTDNHVYGPTHNPWRHGFTAGGSSGGAAAAVAAGMGPLAQGTDGAGSIRIPASLCGVFGHKPSLGRIPHSLLAARFQNWGFQGPITRTVEDAALMMNVVARPSDIDPFSLTDTETDYLEEIGKGISGWRIAWSPDMGLGRHVDPEVLRVCREALAAFEELGATVVEASPSWGNLEATMWRSVWIPGYAPNIDLVDWDAMEGLADDNLIEIMRETRTTAAIDVARAEAARGDLWGVFIEFMRDFDLIVSPTLASAAFPLDRFAPDWLDGEPLSARILGWLLTYPFNMLATPASSVPAGFTTDGRPVGLQIAGRPKADAAVLRASAAFESVRPWAYVTP